MSRRFRYVVGVRVQVVNIGLRKYARSAHGYFFNSRAIGGPYVILGASAEYDVLVAITSFGEGCARGGLPDVATRVSAFHEWILCVFSGACTAAPTASPTHSWNDSHPKNSVAVGGRSSDGRDVWYNVIPPLFLAGFVALILPLL